MSDEYNISASQVKTHSSCPGKWWFNYESDKPPSKGAKGYRALGSRVHEAIEDCLTAESPPPLDHEKAIRAGIQNLYREKEEYSLTDDFFEDGLEYCERAAKYIAKHVDSYEEVELRHEYRIKSLDTGVTAIIDLISDGRIIDWKTGRVRDETPHEEQIQGAIYMAAYYDKYDEPPEEIVFVYLKENKVRSLDPGDEIWNYMTKYAQKLVMAKESGDFPFEPGDACYFCDHEFHCPASPAGVGNVPVEEY